MRKTKHLWVLVILGIAAALSATAAVASRDYFSRSNTLAEPKQIWLEVDQRDLALPPVTPGVTLRHNLRIKNVCEHPVTIQGFRCDCRHLIRPDVNPRVAPGEDTVLPLDIHVSADGPNLAAATLRIDSSLIVERESIQSVIPITLFGSVNRLVEIHPAAQEWNTILASERRVRHKSYRVTVREGVRVVRVDANPPILDCEICQSSENGRTMFAINIVPSRVPHLGKWQVPVTVYCLDQAGGEVIGAILSVEGTTLPDVECQPSQLLLGSVRIGDTFHQQISFLARGPRQFRVRITASDPADPMGPDKPQVIPWVLPRLFEVLSEPLKLSPTRTTDFDKFADRHDFELHGRVTHTGIRQEQARFLVEFDDGSTTTGELVIVYYGEP